MTLPCSEIEDLLAPYALDALDGADRTAVLEHVAECREHDAVLDDYRVVAARLAEVLEDEAPPATLQDNLLDAFDAAVRGQPVDPAPPAPPSPAAGEVAPLRPRPGLLRFVRRPAFAYGIAAALLALAIGLGVWNQHLRNENSSLLAATVVRDADQGTMKIHVLYVPKEKLAVLDVDLPALAADRTYQAWQITDRGALSLGVLANKGPYAVQTDLANASAVAITVEPAGGSVQPTSRPVLVSPF